MPHVEQELPTLPKHLSSLPFFVTCLSGVRVVLVGNLHINTFLVSLRFPHKHDVQIVLSPISFVGVHVL